MFSKIASTRIVVLTVTVAAVLGVFFAAAASSAQAKPSYSARAFNETGQTLTLSWFEGLWTEGPRVTLLNGDSMFVFAEGWGARNTFAVAMKLTSNMGDFTLKASADIGDRRPVRLKVKSEPQVGGAMRYSVTRFGVHDSSVQVNERITLTLDADSSE